MSNSYTEDHLIEQPAIQLMKHELGWAVEGTVEEICRDFFLPALSLAEANREPGRSGFSFAVGS